VWHEFALSDRLLASIVRRMRDLPGYELFQQAIEQVARQLGNTKAVCRKCYIHPNVIDAYHDGSLAQAMTSRSIEACVKRLLGRRRKQRSLMPLLKQSLRRLRRRGTQIAAGAQMRKGGTAHVQAA